MALQFSTGLKSTLLIPSTGQSLGDALDNGQIKIYTGAPPASADAAVTGTLLNTYSADAGSSFNCTFEGTLDAGSLVKAVAETWSGTSVAAGAAGYFRYIVTGDVGDLSTSAIRIQGTVGGAGADLFLASTNFTNTTLYYIDAFAIAIPDL